MTILEDFEHIKKLHEEMNMIAALPDKSSRRKGLQGLKDDLRMGLIEYQLKYLGDDK